MKTTYLNVGCGSRFCKGEPWINLDVAPSDPEVTPWDVRAGFPMDANSLDVVYHSNVLEHFTAEAGTRMIAECYRVLKPGGILRVVVPDLEGICREYLRILDQARTTPLEHPDRLTWIKLELLDQCTRHETGGSMRTFFRDRGQSELDYVIGRIGTMGLNLTKACRPPATSKWSWALLCATLRQLLLNREEREALRIGQFRTQGEAHLYMYESISLEHLLKKAGFETVEFHRADTSQIANLGHFHLDQDAQGLEHAPNSLYAEGRKCPS